MDMRETFTVRPQDERPNRRDGTCFYCRQPIGALHNEECVCRRKTVVVEVTIHVVLDEPQNWDAHSIEFHLNESSYCADNLLEAMGRWADKHDRDDHPCSCSAVAVAFLRDATDQDHANLPVLDDGE